VAYNDSDLNQAEVDLKLLHYDGPDTRDITTTVDTLLNEICGRTDSLSVFAIAEPTEVAGVPAGHSATSKVTQNFPSPYCPVTTIRFELPDQSPVSLRVYNVAGRLMRVLVDSKVYGAGLYTVTWDGRDGEGVAVASGIHFYVLEAGRHRETKKMVLTR
jgi:hypothetical protein